MTTKELLRRPIVHLKKDRSLERSNGPRSTSQLYEFVPEVNDCNMFEFWLLFLPYDQLRRLVFRQPSQLLYRSNRPDVVLTIIRNRAQCGGIVEDAAVRLGGCQTNKGRDRVECKGSHVE
jgi:hypothetical protein